MLCHKLCSDCISEGIHVCVHSRVLHLGDVDTRGLLAKFLIFVPQYLIILTLVERRVRTEASHTRQKYTQRNIHAGMRRLQIQNKREWPAPVSARLPVAHPQVLLPHCASELARRLSVKTGIPMCVVPFYQSKLAPCSIYL